jgi:hypothetical protein
MKVIIYPQDTNNSVSVIIPAPEYADQVEAIAHKNVPEGKPWRIIEDSDLPPRAFRDQWQWTDSGPISIEQTAPNEVTA